MRLFHLALMGGLLAGGPAVTPALAQGAAPTIIAQGQSRSAIVETVDQRARQVLLRGEDGGLHTFNVGPEIRNLGQLRPNDVVTVEFGEAVAFSVADPADGAAATEAAMGAARARPGLRPGMGAAQAFRVRVTIDAVDARTGTVTFTGPLGATRSARPRNPQVAAFVRGLRPGQQVDVVYAETVVIRARPRP